MPLASRLQRKGWRSQEPAGRSPQGPYPSVMGDAFFLSAFATVKLNATVLRSQAAKEVAISLAVGIWFAS